MSNLDVHPGVSHSGGLEGVSARPVHELYTGREVLLGEATKVRRLLPNLGRRLIAAWCFIDHYGRDNIAATPGMQVPPHPHTGLQTLSWLLDGEVHHRDSLGSNQIIRPGQLGAMTAGHGIAHSEQSPASHPDRLHGVQLWVALPEHARHMAPDWQHVAELPTFASGDLDATVFMGTLDGANSPARAHTPLVGADLKLDAGGSGLLPLEEDFEYAVLSMRGAVEVDGVSVSVGSVLYLGTGRNTLRLRATGPESVHAMLLGGIPFEEHIVMWWNFLGRSTEDIAEARAQWMDEIDGRVSTGAGRPRFGSVTGYTGGPALAAPALPSGPLKPGGAVRRPYSSSMGEQK